MKMDFIESYNQTWLYASDEVLRATNKFFQKVKNGKKLTDDQKKDALREVVLAMRKDIMKKTNMKKDEFDTYIPASKL